MDIELKEIQDFLAAQVTFSELPETVLTKLVRSITIRYLRRGQVFPPHDVEEANLYLVRNGAIELRNADGQLVEKLAEADCYLEPCLDEETELLKGHASEDSLIYLLPCSELNTLRKESDVFDQHFASTAQQRIRHAGAQPGVPVVQEVAASAS